jgi:hypothetical protein
MLRLLRCTLHFRSGSKTPVQRCPHHVGFPSGSDVHLFAIRGTAVIFAP